MVSLVATRRVGAKDDRTRLEDQAGQFALEEAADVPGHLEERLEVDVVRRRPMRCSQ
jgi:hypothetical protein